MSTTPIVIIAGQSNAALSALPSGAAEALAAMGAIVVHHAVSGSPLSAEKDTNNQGDWEASGDAGSGEHLMDLQARVDAIVTPGAAGYIDGAFVAGMIWVQGEADAISRVAAAEYEDNLALLHSALVARYGDHEMVVSMLSADASAARQEGVHNPVKEAGWAVVRQAQADVAAADPTVSVVDPDALADALGLSISDVFREDLTHYTDEFGALLGKELAAHLSLSGDAQLHVGTDDDDWFTVADTPVAQQFLGFGRNDTVDFSGLGFAVRVESYLGEFTAAEARFEPARLDVSMARVETIIGTAQDDLFKLGPLCRKVEAGAGRDRVTGADGLNDNIKLGDGWDLAWGRGGDDSLRGEAGTDRLFGGAGNDKLLGGDGKDVLRGGAGDDWLFGGTGADVIFGGDGADAFVWRRNEYCRDVVKDFTQGEDRLVLEGTGLGFDDLEISTTKIKLRIDAEGHGIDVRIVLVGGQDLTLTEDDFLF